MPRNRTLVVVGDIGEEHHQVYWNAQRAEWTRYLHEAEVYRVSIPSALGPVILYARDREFHVGDGEFPRSRRVQNIGIEEIQI